jgi:hypothetical protein
MRTFAAIAVVGVAQTQAGLIENIADVVEGVFIGALDKEGAGKYTQECVKDSQAIWDDLYQGVEDFEKLTFTGVADGIQVFGEALTMVDNDFKECGKAAELELEKFEKMLDLFVHPFSLAYTVGVNLLLNGIDILYLTGAAVEDWKHGQFVDFGTELGKILVDVLGGQDDSAKKPEELTEETFLGDLGLVFQGLIEGALNEQGLINITNCTVDVSKTYTDVSNAITEIEKKDFFSVLAGLKDAAAALKDAGAAISTCPKVGDDIEKIDKIIKMFGTWEDPFSFYYHVGLNLIFNGADIFDEVWDGVADFNNSKYEEFGKEFGSALAKTFLSTNIKYPNHKNTGFLQW